MLMIYRNDLRRRATCNDPAWKYGFWPDLERKDLLLLLMVAVKSPNWLPYYICMCLRRRLALRFKCLKGEVPPTPTQRLILNRRLKNIASNPFSQLLRPGQEL